MPGLLDIMTAAASSSATASPAPRAGFASMSGALQDALRDPLEDFRGPETASGGRSLRSKLAGLGKKKKSTEVDPRVKQAAAKMKLPQVRAQFRDLLFEHLVERQQEETLLFLEAIDAGMDDARVIDTFIREGAEQEINVRMATRRDILDGTSKPDSAYVDVERLISGDVLPRFRDDPKLLAALTARL